MELLNFRSEDVKTRVELEKQQQLIPRREVEGWLKEVGDVQNEVDAILREGGLVFFSEAVIIFGRATTLERE